MKKFIFIFTLFIMLICISSFSWATYEHDGDDSNYSNSTFTTTNNLEWYSPQNIFDCLEFSLNEKSISYMSLDDFTDNTFYLAAYTYNYDTNKARLFAFVPDVPTYNVNYNDTEIYFYWDSSYTVYVFNMFYNNASYGVSFQKWSEQSADVWTNPPPNNTQYYERYSNDISKFSSPSFPISSFVPTQSSNNSGGDSGGESGGEEEESGGILDFLTNFWSNFGTNLVHIVVPNSEDWSDLQDSFEDNILDKFNITSMSFNNDLNYDWRSYNTFRK